MELKTGQSEELTIYKKSIFLKQGKTKKAIEEIKKLKKLDKSSAKYDLEIAAIYGREEAYEVIRKSQLDYQNKFLK